MSTRTYECEECGLRFYTTDGLAIHHQTLHQPKTEPETIETHILKL